MKVRKSLVRAALVIFGATVCSGCSDWLSAMAAGAQRQELSRELSAGEVSARQYSESASDLDRACCGSSGEPGTFETASKGRR
ncbi:MAG: hypothetical protein U0136_03050 [Bdellovibrionota bacterium]